MQEFKVGDRVMRVKGSFKGMEVGDYATVAKVTLTGLELQEYADGHDQYSFVVLRDTSSIGYTLQCKAPTQLKGESNMKKEIIVPHKAISKIIFLYDNGKKHHAAKIKKFDASTKDIDGTECIEYSNHTGAHRVYRDDLAAITFVCADGYTTTQKLMDKVVVEADNARMYKKAR